jgi:hypothetical protein
MSKIFEVVAWITFFVVLICSIIVYFHKNRNSPLDQFLGRHRFCIPLNLVIFFVFALAFFAASIQHSPHGLGHGWEAIISGALLVGIVGELIYIVLVKKRYCVQCTILFAACVVVAIFASVKNWF